MTSNRPASVLVPAEPFLKGLTSRCGNERGKAIKGPSCVERSELPFGPRREALSSRKGSLPYCRDERLGPAWLEPGQPCSGAQWNSPYAARVSKILTQGSKGMASRAAKKMVASARKKMRARR